MGMTVGADTTTGWHLFFNFGAASPSAPQLITAAQGIADQYAAYLAPHAHFDTILTGVVLTDLTSSSSAVGQVSVSTPGGLSGDRFPASTSMLVNLHVNRRYRGGKPRFYIPTGVPGNLQDPQTWASTFLTQFHTDFTTFINASIGFINAFGSGAALVNVSYYLGGEWKPDQNGNYHRVPTPRSSPHVDPVTSWTLNPVIGSQRRRVRPR
jgi:hypothetical protein